MNLSYYSHQVLFDQNLDAVNKIIKIDRQVEHYYRQIELDGNTEKQVKQLDNAVNNT